MTLPRVDGRLGRWLFPPRCLVCAAPGHAGRDLCPACLAELPWNRHACALCALPLPPQAPPGGPCGDCLRRAPAFDRARAPLRYADPVDRLIRDLKFHRRLAAGGLLVGLLAEAVGDDPRPELLLPVPMHPARLRERGYNQALELARPLGRRLGLPVAPRLLRRVRATPPQAGLEARVRRRNLRGAFALSGELGGMHVALVDDVVTTGSTVSELARVLRRAGAAGVSVWAVARTPHPRG